MNALWYVARGAGLSALIVLTAATTLGALGSIKTADPANRVIVQYLHRTAAVLGLLLIATHVTTIVLDQRSHLGLRAVLVPFASSYRPGAVAMGTFAAYTVVLVSVLGLARGRLAATARGAASWRGLHSLAYLAWGLAVLHGINAGTDRSQRWMLLITLVCITAVVVGLGGRLLAGDADRGAPVNVRRPSGARR